MRRALILRKVGHGVTVQDLGRPGHLGAGLSRGGAADRLALFEGAALLQQPPGMAAIEMAAFGGEFEATADVRIALTGAPMRAMIDGAPAAWNASHALPRGAVLSIGGAVTGTYGYLHVGGGIETPQILGSRSAHLAAGLLAPLEAGTTLPVGPESRAGQTGLCLEPDPRFEGGRVRAVPGPQSRLFSDEQITRFTGVAFRRDTRGNRMGVRLLPDGDGFATPAGLSILSEVVVPGDIQVTGDGTPFVLLAECQTTGGYPRIGTVIGADLPRVAQARPGAILRFEFLTLEAGRVADVQERRRIVELRSRIRPLIRYPASIPDLLSYQLISGVTAGND
jgi:allophanate hydrolase